MKKKPKQTVIYDLLNLCFCLSLTELLEKWDIVV